MKKKLVASLAAAMVLGVAGTSFAAANPFTDVPAKHWAYASVTKLAQAGIVDGYGDGTYLGDKMISRYEMAQIVAKAMARSDKADAAQKAIIDQLSVEFASELEGLNVRVTKIEKNASSIKVSGEARLRYDRIPTSADTHNNTYILRTRVNLDGQINDQWSYYGRLQAENNLQRDGVGTNTANSGVSMNNAFVKGPIAGVNLTAGRFDYFMNNGLLIDSTLNGVQFDFGNVVKTKVFYGNENNATVLGQNDARVTGAALNYGTSKVSNVNGGYYQFEDKTANTKIKVWELGFNSKFAADWGLKSSYGKSDATTQNKAYFAQVDYKGADKKVEKTYGVSLGYRNLEANVAPTTTFDGAYAFGSQANGGKGYELGFAYVPMKNSVVTLKYADLKTTTVGETKSKYYLAQAEFFF